MDLANARQGTVKCRPQYFACKLLQYVLVYPYVCIVCVCMSVIHTTIDNIHLIIYDTTHMHMIEKLLNNDIVLYSCLITIALDFQILKTHHLCFLQRRNRQWRGRKSG